MKFTISKHAFEKHLDPCCKNASVFFSKFMMNTCVKQCLYQPDTFFDHGEHIELTKRFPFSIGLASDKKRTNETVKVVYTKKKNSYFVITAYPVGDIFDKTKRVQTLIRLV